MDLKPLFTSTTAWSWLAMDFSSNELISEHFAVRFKLEETAKLFQQKFVEGQTALKNGADPSSFQAAEPPIRDLSMAEKFKPQEGSWECQGCFLRNASEITKCPSCETLKPGTSGSETINPAPLAAETLPEAKEGETVAEHEETEAEQDEEDYEDVEESIMYENQDYLNLCCVVESFRLILKFHYLFQV